MGALRTVHTKFPSPESTEKERGDYDCRGFARPRWRRQHGPRRHPVRRWLHCSRRTGRKPRRWRVCAGRGGAGNIGDVGTPTTGHRTDVDLVPEQAQLPPSKIGDHHTGRGGAGNEERVGTPPAEKKEDSPVGLADKLKQKLFKKK